jgi:hypothetical protein
MTLQGAGRAHWLERRGRWAAWLQWQGRAVDQGCQTRPVPVLLCSRPARVMNSHTAAGRGQLGALRLPKSSAAQRLVLGAVPRRARRACRPELARTTQAVAAPPQQRSSGNGVAVAEPGTDLEVDSVLAKELGENGAALRPSWLDSGDCMFERSRITPGACAAGFRSTRRTKIICTIGPTSCSEEMLETLAVNGMNVARLNMCHGSREWHHEIIERIRRLNKDKGCAHQAPGSARSLVRSYAPLLTRACAGVCHHEPVNSLQSCCAHTLASARFSVAIMLDTEGSEVHTSALEQPIKAEARHTAAHCHVACFDGHAVQPAACSKPWLPLPPQGKALRLTSEAGRAAPRTAPCVDDSGVWRAARGPPLCLPFPGVQESLRRAGGSRFRHPR